jgi:hypothetical protein
MSLLTVSAVCQFRPRPALWPALPAADPLTTHLAQFPIPYATP